MMVAVLRPPSRGLLPTAAFGGTLQIDRSHPLAQGLIGCYVPGIAGGINLAGIGPTLTLESSAAIGASQEGPALDSTAIANAGMFGTAAPQFKTGNNFSLYWRSFLPGTGTAGTNEAILQIGYDSAGGSPFWVYGMTVKNAAYASIQLNWNEGGTLTSVPASWSPTLGRVNSLASTFAFGGGPYAIYGNGVSLLSGTTGGASPSSTATSEVGINSFSSSGGRTNSLNHLSLFYNRTLSADEVKALDADPYGFLSPAEGEMPSMFLSAGGFTAKYRKTLSPLGTRVGSRQTQAA